MKVNTNRVFYRHNKYLLMPEVLVSGKYHITGLKNKYPEVSPWFIKWEPHNPCYYCDKGEIIYNNGKSPPKWWYWQYVELGVDADKHNLPLGLSFLKGNGFNLPERARSIIRKVISYGDSNLATEKEYNTLVKKGFVFPCYDEFEEVIFAKSKNRQYRYLTVYDIEKRKITIDIENPKHKEDK